MQRRPSRSLAVEREQGVMPEPVLIGKRWFIRREHEKVIVWWSDVYGGWVSDQRCLRYFNSEVAARRYIESWLT